MKRCSLDDPFKERGADTLWTILGISFDMGYSGSRFVLNGKKYKPSTFWTLGINNGLPAGCFDVEAENQHEFRSTVCIGLAEILELQGGVRALTRAAAFLFAGFENANYDIEVIKKAYSDSMGHLDGEVALHLLRNGESKAFHSHVRELAIFMLSATYVCPDVFARLVLYIVKNYYIYMVDMLFSREGDCPRFKAIKFSVTTPGKETLRYNITDGRGVAILMAYALLRSIVMSGAGRPISPESEPDFDSLYRSCLTKDIMGRTHDVDSPEYGVFSPYSKIVTTELFHSYHDDGSDHNELLKRCVYESCGLVAYIHSEGKTSQFTLDVHSDKFYYTDVVCYSNQTTILGHLGGLYLEYCTRNMQAEEVKRNKKAVDEAELVALRNDVRNLTAQNQALQEEMASVKEQADISIKNLEYQLERKTQYVERLQLKLDSLENEVQGYYSDDSFNDLPDEIQQLDISHMVEVLNQYRLVIIGGLDNDNLLESYGMNNFTRITSLTNMTGTTAQADFAVVCTRFVAHKLTYLAHKKLNVPSDMFMYFNGVNIEKFIAICYDFIMEKLGGYDD